MLKLLDNNPTVMPSTPCGKVVRPKLENGRKITKCKVQLTKRSTAKAG